MSYDLQLEQTCPHRVVDEALYFELDHFSVRPLRPIASSGSVVVRVNGAVDVPSYGLRIPATAVGSRRGPFQIQSGVNDLIVLRVGADPMQSFAIGRSGKFTAETLADILNPNLSGVEFNVSGSAISIRTSAEGAVAQLFLDPASTLAPVLGIPTSRIWQGRTTIPGWILVSDPNTLIDRPSRLVVFDEPLKGYADYVEISYGTIQQECRRCGGMGVEMDWRTNVSGQQIRVTDETLLLQEFMKIVYTEIGTNPFHRWYGTTLMQAIGTKLTSGQFIQNLIMTEVQDAFRRWQSIKRQQETDVGQAVSDGEYPFRLAGVQVEQSTQDPTVVFVDITIQSRSGQPIQLSRGLTLPQGSSTTALVR